MPSPSRKRCMMKGCDKPPEQECLWADGRGRAWFCAPHYKQWKESPKEEVPRDIVRERQVKHGEVGKKYGEEPGAHKGQHSRVAGRDQVVAAAYLSKIAMDPCDPEATSYAWIDPDGTLFQVGEDSSHDVWAHDHLAAKVTKEQAYKEMGLEPRWWAENYLLWKGWVRVAGAFGYEEWRGKSSGAARRAAVDLTADCLKKWRGVNPEKRKVYLDQITGVAENGQTITKSLEPVAADFLEKWGTKAQVKDFWNTLLGKETPKKTKDWDEFLKSKYEGGKKKVPNTNPETRDKNPEVTVNHLLKTDKAFAKKLQKEFKRWSESGKKAQVVARVYELKKTAGWWAIDPYIGTEIPPPVDKGKLMNAIPGTDPDDAMYLGDGPLDWKIWFLDKLDRIYREVWDRPAYPEELVAVLKSGIETVERDSAEKNTLWWPRNQWLDKAVELTGTPQQILMSLPEEKLDEIHQGYRDLVSKYRPKKGETPVDWDNEYKRLVEDTVHYAQNDARRVLGEPTKRNENLYRDLMGDEGTQALIKTLKKTAVDKAQVAFIVRTNAIEGYRVKPEEVEAALEGIEAGYPLSYVTQNKHIAAQLRMLEAAQRLGGINARSIQELHRVQGGDVLDAGAPGHYRSGGARSGGGTVYVEGDEIPAAMAWWEKQSLAPFTKIAALMQIHPFSDGNGRMGRVALLRLNGMNYTKTLSQIGGGYLSKLQSAVRSVPIDWSNPPWGEGDRYTQERVAARYLEAKHERQTGNGSGVWTGFRIPAPLKMEFPSLGTEDKSPPHVTFLYIGKVEPKRSAELVDIIHDVFRHTEPTRATLTGLDYFTHPADKRRVAIDKVRFDRDFAGLRWVLRERLNDAGFEVADNFPLIYQPHSTLSYMGGLDSEYDKLAPVGSWVVEDIEVWGLPKVHKVPLGGREMAKKASMGYLHEPKYNLREALKQIVLLEDHLSHPQKRCADCINKHLLTLEALCDEGVGLSPGGEFAAVLGSLADLVRRAHQWVIKGGDPDVLCGVLREARKGLMPFGAGAVTS